MREGTIVKRRFYVVLVVLFAAGFSLAAGGQTAVSVFDIEPGVARLGAGGAGISVAAGAETVYYNPASLTEVPGISFSSFFASYMGVASYSAFSLTLRNFGVAALLFNAGGIQGYDAGGSRTDTLAYRNTGFILGAGISPSDLPFIPDLPFDVTVGMRIKGLSSNVGGTRGSGFTVDLGVRTRIPNITLGPVPISDVAFGLTAINLFGALSYETERENFGMDLALGASGQFANLVSAAIDMSLGGHGIHFGLEYWPVSTLALRLGLISKGGISVTAGVGVAVQGIMIDYAYVSHTLGGTHRVSLTVDFSALDVSALSRSLRRILP